MNHVFTFALFLLFDALAFLFTLPLRIWWAMQDVCRYFAQLWQWAGKSAGGQP